MSIKIYNTLGQCKQVLIESKNKPLSMYICGVTPYSNIHLGHARTYIVFDIIKRHLCNRGYLVKHIQNFTDVDDKIIRVSTAKNINPIDLTKQYIKEYFNYTDKLNILRANKYPCVTNVITDIIQFIESLIRKGYAYISNNSVYFCIKKFPTYGKLSNRHITSNHLNIINKVNINKREVRDFVLWKDSKQSDPKEFIWNSPWGKGRPGWHIECSVLAFKYLGSTIDIHGGGNDLIFPHHENEIAQSEARNNKQFAKFWIHSGFVTIDGDKMSKSLNNFVTLEDLFTKYDANTIRYCLLTQHYSKPLRYSTSIMTMAKQSMYGLNESYTKLLCKINNILLVKKKCNTIKTEIVDADLIDLKIKFLNALDNNFNSEQALSYLHVLKNITLNDLFSASIQRLYQLKKLFKEFSYKSLGLALVDFSENENMDLRILLKERQIARKNKNWKRSDQIKKLLQDHGYNIIDTSDGNSILIKKSYNK
ncbi:MAG: cysteine--tRNA ligase [Endomicrobium sp.]|jgi:cysteinyl-tRNA synthetase|nr:cysteine--tRNA ligase [Endomicrobium sp.]